MTTRWMLLRPQESARSLSQTVTRLIMKAKMNTGQSRTIGEMPMRLDGHDLVGPGDPRENRGAGQQQGHGHRDAERFGEKIGNQPQGRQQRQTLRRGLAADKAQHDHQGQRRDGHREDFDDFDEDVAWQDRHGRLHREDRGRENAVCRGR